MSTNQTWNDFGTEVREAIQDALQTGDFKNFNEIVLNAGTEALKNAGIQIRQEAGQRENQTEKWLRENNPTGSRSASGRRLSPDEMWRPSNVKWKSPNEKWQPQPPRRQPQTVKRQSPTSAYMPARIVRAPFRRIGSVSGTLYQVFGGIGTGVLSVLSTTFLGLGIGLGGGFWTAFMALASALMVFVGMIKVGSKKKTVLKRAEKYLELAGNNHYINVEDIALHTGLDLKFILKDIRRMLAAGFYPEGHLDRQESCLMLDNKIYNEYVQLEKQRRLQEQEIRAITEQPKAEQPSERAKTAPQGAEINSEVAAMIAEGQDYIRKLRDLNDNIPGEEISAKLFRLENLLREIFDRLKEHPEQAPQMQKFLKYYLPTTLKLVDAYEEFDSVSEQGADIREAKNEIEKTLDTINNAFGELLNRLLRDTAYDVTTDAQVLQTMLAKEGLTKEPEFEYVNRN